MTICPRLEDVMSEKCLRFTPLRLDPELCGGLAKSGVFGSEAGHGKAPLTSKVPIGPREAKPSSDCREGLFCPLSERSSPALFRQLFYTLMSVS